jgi:hypothetical protein
VTVQPRDPAGVLDLGPDYYAARTNPERKVRRHVRELQALGYTVTLNLNPAARPGSPGDFGSGGVGDSRTHA